MRFRVFFSLLLLLSFVSSIGAALAAAGSGRVGGWEEMQNINADQHVNEIAEFAVAEINKKANSQLKLLGVIKGKMQVVSGLNYKLLVAVQDGGALGKYEAVVWEKPWLRLKTLTSYRPA